MHFPPLLETVVNVKQSIFQHYLPAKSRRNHRQRHKQLSLEESLEGIDVEMSTNKQNPVEITMLDSSKHGDSPNVPVDKPDSIIAAISLMTKQLVSSTSTLNSSMDKSFDEMKESLVNLTEEPNEDVLLNSDAERETENVSNAHKNQSGSGSSDDNYQQPQKNSTKGPEASKEANLTLASIVSTLKLGQKKAPAVNAQFARILKEVMRVKLDDDVLSEAKNLYIRPEYTEYTE